MKPPRVTYNFLNVMSQIEITFAIFPMLDSRWKKIIYTDKKFLMQRDEYLIYASRTNSIQHEQCIITTVSINRV